MFPLQQMLRRHRAGNEQRRQEREDVGLQERHEQFQERHRRRRVPLMRSGELGHLLEQLVAHGLGVALGLAGELLGELEALLPGAVAPAGKVNGKLPPKH